MKKIYLKLEKMDYHQKEMILKLNQLIQYMIYYKMHQFKMMQSSVNYFKIFKKIIYYFFKHIFYVKLYDGALASGTITASAKLYPVFTYDGKLLEPSN